MTDLLRLAASSQGSHLLWEKAKRPDKKRAYKSELPLNL